MSLYGKTENLIQSLSCYEEIGKKITMSHISEETQKSIGALEYLLSGIDILNQEDSLLLLESLLTVKNIPALNTWLKNHPSWWQLLPFIFKPANDTPNILEWKVLEIFITNMYKILPANKYNYFITLYLHNFTAIRENPYFKKLSNNLKNILNKRGKYNTCFNFLLTVDATSRFLDHLLVQKYSRDFNLPNEMFIEFKLPFDANKWEVFDEYYLVTITESSTPEDWLIEMLSHNEKKERQLLCCAKHIIEYANNYNDHNTKYILEYINKQYGSTSIPFLGDKYQNSTRNDLIANANRKIISLLNHKVLDDFFTSFDFDFERQEFWKKYIDKCTTVRLFLKESAFNQQKKNQHLTNRYGRIYNSSSPAVLVMQFGDYVICEFGETGNALYIYNKNQEQFSDLINRTTIQSHNSFKSTFFPTITHTSNYGKLSHYPSWKRIISYWMKDKLP